MLEGVLTALIGGVVTLILTLIGYWGARKAGVGPAQEKLIINLKDLLQTQEDKTKILSEKILEQSARITHLEQELRSLKQLTIRQARLITKLMGEKKSPLSLEELEAVMDDA